MLTTTPSALATIQRAFPPHIAATEIKAAERVLRNDRGEVVITGPNGRGGFGYRFPGQPKFYGNYPTQTDLERSCALDGYYYEGEIKS